MQYPESFWISTPHFLRPFCSLLFSGIVFHRSMKYLMNVSFQIPVAVFYYFPSAIPIVQRQFSMQLKLLLKRPPLPAIQLLNLFSFSTRPPIQQIAPSKNSVHFPWDLLCLHIQSLPSTAILLRVFFFQHCRSLILPAALLPQLPLPFVPRQQL